MQLKLTFSQKLFLVIILLFWFFAGSFVVYQYWREKNHKIELLNERLAVFNNHLEEYLKDSDSSEYPQEIKSLIDFSHLKNLRITIILPNGKILYDTRQDAQKMGSHMQREELKMALRYGTGYAIKRRSETLDEPYFYFATYFPQSGFIIRSALPYDLELDKRLQPDSRYLWIILAITLVFTLAIYQLTARLGHTITQLRLFAKKADMGEPFQLSIQPTGNNELDMIAQHIIDIYYRLKRTKDELYISREKLIAHLQISRQGLAVFNAKREIILSNALFHQYARLIADGNLEKIEEVFECHEFLPLVRFIKDKHNTDKGNDIKPHHVIIDKNGYIFSVDAVVFQDASFELTITDITQQEEQARMKKQITQNMAHELKTPVSSIQGYIETILNNPNLPQPTLQQFLQRSYAQVTRLGNLVNDIATITRMDEAGTQIDTEELDLSIMIQNICSELSLPLKEKKMQINCAIPPQMPITGNYSLLYSIFRNLCDNAIAYAGEEVTINIKCILEDEQFYFFSFADNGVGVDSKHLNRLFERFYRVDKGRSRKIGGTGLGLAIVKNAVLFHGGTIHARQAKEGGLEFLFMLQKTTQKHE